MNDSRRLTASLLLIVGAAVLSNGMEKLPLSATTEHVLLTIFTVVFLFLFGMSLNRKKRSNAIISKVVAVVITVLLLFMQLGYFYIPNVTTWFAFLGIDAFYTNMLYIFCGYLFAD